MDDQTPNANSADANEMQFDQAEFPEPTSGEPVCVACHQTILDHYFQVNGQVLCEGCCSAAKASLTGGSKFLRFVKANLFGFGAAIAGFAIYFGVLKLTGYQIGLISILVGYMVGAAVRMGSEGRGGLLYQLTAVFFTYLAIAFSYSALVIPQIIQKIEAEKAELAQAEIVQPDNAANLKNNNAVAPNTGAVGADAEVEKGLVDKPDQPPVVKEALTPIGFMMNILLVLAVMLALPIIAGFEQPIGLLIVAFALWEAFKLNKKTVLVITGPHNVGPPIDRVPADA